MMGIVLLLVMPALAQVHITEEEEDPVAVLTVHVQTTSATPIPGAAVLVEVTSSLSFVKVYDGLWTPFSTLSATTNTDANGDAMFQIARASSYATMDVRVTACGQIFDMTYSIGPKTAPHSHVLIVICGPDQVIPETPLLGTFGIGILMLLAFLFKQRRSIKL
jgi:hypothetical protein